MIDAVNIARGQIFWRNVSEERNIQSYGVTSMNRPVIVVSNDVRNAFSPSVLVVPLTTSAQRGDSCTCVPIYYGDRPSWVLCDQLSTCSKSDLAGYISTVLPKKMEEIDLGIHYALGLTDLPAPDNLDHTYYDPSIAQDDKESASDSSSDSNISIVSSSFEEQLSDEERSEFVRSYYEAYVTPALISQFLHKYDLSSMDEARAAVDNICKH